MPREGTSAIWQGILWFRVWQISVYEVNRKSVELVKCKAKSNIFCHLNIGKDT